jgi:hypothetical protein
VWKLVPGYGGHYEASSWGRVRSLPRTVTRHSAVVGRVVDFQLQGKILSARTGKYGHKFIHTCIDGRRYSAAVHRMVLAAFVGPQPEGMEACHNDGNAGNNLLSNLRWDTHAANNADRRRHGRYAKGEAHHLTKLTLEQVRAIRSAGSTKEAARSAGISYPHARRIRLGIAWAGVE